MTENNTTIESLVLPEQAGTTAVSELYAALKDADGNDLVIDASGVERLGALVVQLIIVAEKRWLEMSKTFSIKDPSTEFIKTGTRLGLAHLLPQELDGECA